MSRQILGFSVLFGTLSLVQQIGEPSTGLVSQPIQSLLKEWDSGAGEIAMFVALLGAPWCLKPLYGLLTDFVPLAGYRRKSYLIAATFAAAACFLWLVVVPFSNAVWSVLFLGLFFPSLAIAVSDVVLDALVIEAGQSLRVTGLLQSVVTAAGFAATLLTGAWGGALSEGGQQQLGFLACGLLTAATLMLAVFCVHEGRHAAPPSGRRLARQKLIELVRQPGLWTIGAFLFAWHFNPFSETVLQSHVTGPLAFSHRDYGEARTLTAVGAIAACAVYVVVCRRIALKRLVHGSIVVGAFSTLAYWPLSSGCDMTWISLVHGFSYMAAMMVLMDLAAQACPLNAAGTVFAFWMSLCNASTVLSTWVGGYCYEAGVARWGSATGFSLLLALGAGCTMCSWLAARRLPRELLA